MYGELYLVCGALLSGFFLDITAAIASLGEKFSLHPWITEIVIPSVGIAIRAAYSH
jgi:hypothetical protein